MREMRENNETVSETPVPRLPGAGLRTAESVHRLLQRGGRTGFGQLDWFTRGICEAFAMQGKTVRASDVAEVVYKTWPDNRTASIAAKLAHEYVCLHWMDVA